MGIYGALANAVSGLRAQGFALENISGNIANSQTIGFKRIDTEFLDLIPDAPQTRQTAGSVLAQSRSTNTVQGDVKSVSSETNMAINGNGFFVVEPAIGQADGNAIFANTNFYTRRGDFELDKSGYLVNGAGYYLKGLPIDPQSQNISGSVPEPLQISNAFLPASPTTRISYQLNLPQLPKTAQFAEDQVKGSELLSAGEFVDLPADTPATSIGNSANGTGSLAGLVEDGNQLSIQVNADPAVVISFVDGDGTQTAGTTVDINDPSLATLDDLIAHINSQLTGATVGIVDGKIQVAAGAVTDNITVNDGTIGFGLADGTFDPTVSQAAALAVLDGISAADSDQFINQSISGGAITVYSENGAATNVQMRWAKIGSEPTDDWSLFILSDGDATGDARMWTRVDQAYSFSSDGTLAASVENTDLSGYTVNGVTLDNIVLDHGKKGLTQFADANGTAEVTSLSQNGYAAGEFVSVAINDNGRVVVSYSNGQQVERAQVVTANFNAANQLKRMDGGVFAATSESGEPILDNDGGIIGASVEASNTDISEEFTKLIVTQQAYAAGTRIVSTADEMLQEALNMVR